MSRLRRARFGVLVLAAAVLSASEAWAAGMQAKVAGFKRAGAALRVALEIQDVFTERMRRVVDQGGTLYVRVEAELWEQRSVWDRLVQASAVSVARLTAEAVSRSVVLVDAFGQASTYPDHPRVMIVWADLVPASRVADDKTYFVQATLTVGTLAEGEINSMSAALFGNDREASGLGSLGKMVFQKVLRLADYLDSITCDTRSGRIPGRQIAGK